MTDDERLAALFRDAAASSDPPPPAFDHDRVVATSRRVTARRRSAVLGAAMAVLVVAGVGVAVALPSSRTDVSTAAAPAPAPEAAAPAPETATPEVFAEPVEPFRAPTPRAEPGTPPTPDTAQDSDATAAAEAQPGSAPFTGTPLGPSTAECAPRQDPELRAYLEQVVPEVVGAPEAAVTMECRPGGERGVNLEVDDAGVAGLLTVQYLPPGAAVDETDGAQAPTASGGTVVVSSRGTGPGAAVPFEGRLDTAAAFLAPRL